MHLIIKDVLLRWRWLIIAGLLLAIPSGFSTAPVALVMLHGDIRAYKILTVLRTQPVDVRHVARAWWFVFVFMLPLLVACLSALGPGLWTVLDFGNKDTGTAPLWYRHAFNGAINSGLCAVVYACCLLQPSTLPKSNTGRLAAAVIGASWIAAFQAAFWLPVFLPRSLNHANSWQWIAVGVAAMLVAAAYIISPTLLKRLQNPATQKAQSPPSLQTCELGLKTTYQVKSKVLLLFGMLFRHVMIMILLISLTGWAYMLWQKGSVPISQQPFFTGMLGVMAALQSTQFINFFHLRSLRTLPLTTTTLALLLSSVPLLTGVLVSLLAAIAHGLYGEGDIRWAQTATVGFMTAGLGALGLACNLRFGGYMSVLIVMPLSLFIMVQSGDSLSFWQTSPAQAGLAILGLLLFLLSTAYIQRGLRRSSAFYRVHRSLQAGMNPA